MEDNTMSRIDITQNQIINKTRIDLNQKIIIFLLVVFFIEFGIATILSAATYYVSYSDGDDYNCNGLSSTPYSGTGSGVSCPWKNLSKLDSGLVNGDTILLKRGDVWDGSRGIRIKYNLTVDAYGTGDKPLIKTTNADGYGAIYGYAANLYGVVVRNIKVVGVIGFTQIGKNISVQNCDVISSIGGNGIVMKQINGYLIEGCNVDNAACGIAIIGSIDNKVANGIVRNCTVGPNISGDDISIHADSSNNTTGGNHQILNNKFLGAGENCVDTAVGDVGVRPSGLLVKGNSCTGSLSYGMGASMNDITFENNYIYNVSGAAFYLGYTNNTIIRYNLTINPGYEAVGVTDTTVRFATNSFIYNNTFVDGPKTARSSIRIYPAGGYNKGFIIKNNIIVNEQNKFIEFASTSSPDNTLSTFDNNLYYASAGYIGKWAIGAASYNSLDEWKNALGGKDVGSDKYSLTTNPIFKSFSEYNLQVNSPAINAGADVGLSKDYLENPIAGTPDIGAYEYQTAVSTPNNIKIIHP